MKQSIFFAIVMTALSVVLFLQNSGTLAAFGIFTVVIACALWSKIFMELSFKSKAKELIHTFQVYNNESQAGVFPMNELNMYFKPCLTVKQKSSDQQGFKKYEIKINMEGQPDSIEATLFSVGMLAQSIMSVRMMRDSRTIQPRDLLEVSSN